MINIYKLSLSIRLLTFFIFVTIYPITAVAQSPLDFFPHRVGNLWQYRLSIGHLMWTEIIDTVYNDTNGITYVGYTNVNHDGNTTIQKGWYVIVDSNLVYIDLLPRIGPISRLLYKLDAILYESWVVNYMGDSTYREVAFVYNINKTLAYGKEVIIKDIQYGITESPYSDTVWWDFRTIAEGFGLIWAQLEPMAPVYLTGAIINGVRYGYIVSVDEIENKPKEFILYQNYPNPFNPVTIISYQLSENSIVKLKIYDLLGREIKTLIDEHQVAKTYSIKIDASTLSAGTYFYQLQTKGGVLTKKMTLIK